MSIQKASHLFDNYTHYNNTLPVYFYELVWQTLEKDNFFQNTNEFDQLNELLFAYALVDFFKEFEFYATDEFWSAEEFTFKDFSKKHYDQLCQLLNIEPMTIHDLYSDAELAEENFSKEDIELILQDECPSFSDLFLEHAQGPYRTKLLSALKKHYDLSDLFVFMTTALGKTQSQDDYWHDFDDEMDEYREDGPIEITNLETFIESADQNADEILSDMEYIRAYEWLDAVY